MSKKMTLIEMYQGCYKMWSELAKTGYDCKPKTNLLHDCYACEYHKQHGGFKENYICGVKLFKCTGNCPMSKCWGSTTSFGCECKGSPFVKWSDFYGTIDNRKRYAKQIADFCANELRKRKKGLLPRRSK